MDLNRERTRAFEVRDRLLTSLKAEINVHYIWRFISYRKENRVYFHWRDLSVHAAYEIIGVCCEKYRMLLNIPFGKWRALNIKPSCKCTK
jgi:hypothetical protein